MADMAGILRKLLENIVEQRQYKNAQISFKELTSGGANYTSALFSATITSSDNEPLKLFAKVANASEQLRETMSLDYLFTTEHYVYTKLTEEYEKIQDKHNVSPEHRFVFPKFYGAEAAQGHEAVVMEDLMVQGYHMYSRFKSIDWEHAVTAATSLARFHALSFAFQHEDPEKFAEAAEKFKYSYVMPEEDEALTDTFLKIVDRAVSAAKEEHRERLTQFLLYSLEDNPEAFHQYKMPLGTVVLCHGDYRVSNLLFKRQNGKLDQFVVDYQTVHTGCPAIDLLYLEFMSTDEEFRREHHEQLVECYFTEFTAALDRLGLDVNEVYPRETFDEEFKQMIGPTLRAASVVLPLVLVEAEQAPTFGAVSSVHEFVISPTQLFEERWSGIVSDCVRWGAV